MAEYTWWGIIKCPCCNNDIRVSFTRSGGFKIESDCNGYNGMVMSLRDMMLEREKNTIRQGISQENIAECLGERYLEEASNDKT